MSGMSVIYSKLSTSVFFFIDKLAFQFKMQTKMLERQAATHDKQEKVERDKIRKALVKGNVEAAKIHAENAIRHHSESLTCKRMAARVDGVQARVASSAAQRQVNFEVFSFIFKSRNFSRWQQI
jgi:charged multivesicular body protein 1